MYVISVMVMRMGVICDIGRGFTSMGWSRTKIWIMGRMVLSSSPHSQMTSARFKVGKSVLMECPVTKRRAVDTVEREGVGLVWECLSTRELLRLSERIRSM